MAIEDIRLACLQIAHSHGRSDAEVVERAKKFEEYVTGGNKSAEVPPTLTLPKKADKGGPNRPG